jgi:D-alanyl-D-alanine carboxypeptidase/D-alanyl-D-alanine-endopeptidase (penicillin-binding protein 4)
VSIHLPLFILAVFTINAFAQPLPERLNKVLKAYSVSRDHLGLAVVDLSKTPHPLEFGLNEKEPLTPASTTKIATAATVLRKLGPSFKFQTTLWSAGTVKDGVLKGDLILKGGGDPGFVSETMWFLVNELVRTGIKKIEGNVIVDDTDFDSIRNDPSRDPERVDRAYDAPVGAMSFNWNSINIFVRPAQMGEAPLVYLDPIGDGFSVINKAKTVNKAGTSIDVSRSGNKIRVSGTIGIGAKEFVSYKNIDHPDIWAGENLIFFLSQREISVSGKIKSGKRPESAKLLAKADSKPVSEIVADMMKFSNNFVAEMLTKNLAAQAGTVPASIEAGMKIIRAHLVSLGLAEKNFTLLNPSGLSHKNKMRPVDLALVLVKTYENFPLSAEFLSALPLAGTDGTLKNRMKNGDAAGWVRAKTGLLNGVVGLAGFAGRKDGSVRAFAFIFNGKTEQGDLVRRLFDQLATELVQ